MLLTRDRQEEVMRWLLELHCLKDYTPERLEPYVQALQKSPLYSFSEEEQHGRGGIRLITSAPRNHFRIWINPKDNLANREETLVHELFHIVLSRYHRRGLAMMWDLKCFGYEEVHRLVEDKIEEATQLFCERYPEYVFHLYNRMLKPT